MTKLDYRPYHRRNLPHYQPEGSTFFITFRLTGSLPVEVVERVRSNERQSRAAGDSAATSTTQGTAGVPAHANRFEHWDSELDRAAVGPCWLSDPRIAAIVADSLRFRDNRVYNLDAFCVMPNHVHLVCRPLDAEDGGQHSLSRILQSLKGYTARQCNLILERTGSFWQHESYDRAIRSGEDWHRTVEYVLDNPVKAVLVDQWQDWRWSYLADRFSIE